MGSSTQQVHYQLTPSLETEQAHGLEAGHADGSVVSLGWDRQVSVDMQGNHGPPQDTRSRHRCQGKQGRLLGRRGRLLLHRKGEERSEQLEQAAGAEPSSKGKSLHRSAGSL